MDTVNLGLVQYPLKTATGNGLLKDVDPGFYAFVQFVETTINVLVLARYKEALAALQTRNLLGSLALKDPNRLVQSCLPYELNENLPFVNIPAPFLSASVLKDIVDFNKHGKRTRISDVRVSFTLPPVTTDQYGTLYHFLRAVSGAVSSVVLTGGLDNINSGARVLSTAGLESIELGECSYGNLEASSLNGVVMPTVVMNFVLQEKLSFEDSTDSNLPGSLEVGYAISSIVDMPLEIFEQKLP